MKNIFLIGMPSSGKTTLGKSLARHLRYRFLDTDKLIVKQTGLSIKEIFDQQGEAHFRTMEAATLRAIVPNHKLVVATGGGLPCFFENMAYIKQNGISVFLDVPPPEILKRILLQQANDRPMFDKHNKELLASLQQKYNERYETYLQADIRVESAKTTIHQLIEKLQS